MHEVALGSRWWIVLRAGVGVVCLFVLESVIPRDVVGPGVLVPFMLALGYVAWRGAVGFIAVRVTPTHVELRYLIGERRIARDDVVGVELRVDMAGGADEILNFFDQAGTAGQRAKLRQARMDAATKYRAWVTTNEHKSVRFDDVQRFNALQRALQFAFEGSGGAAPTR